MKILKNLFSTALTIFACLFLLQSSLLAQVESTAAEFIHEPDGYHQSLPKSLEAPAMTKEKVVKGKDLIISSAQVSPVETTKNGAIFYKVDFKVQNIGTEDVKTPAIVLVDLKQFPVNNLDENVFVHKGNPLNSKYLLVNHIDKPTDLFKTNIIGSGETQVFSAYIPEALTKDYQYEVKLKIDGGGDVLETNEFNNDFIIPDSIM